MVTKMEFNKIEKYFRKYNYEMISKKFNTDVSVFLSEANECFHVFIHCL